MYFYFCFRTTVVNSKKSMNIYQQCDCISCCCRQRARINYTVVVSVRAVAYSVCCVLEIAHPILYTVSIRIVVHAAAIGCLRVFSQRSV